MHLPGIERRQLSLLSRTPPRLKIVAILLLILFTALLPRQPNKLYVIPSLALVIFWALARMPLKFVLRRLVVVEVFIISIALLSLIRPASRPIFISALLKSNLCVLAMLVLTWTTPFQEILSELRRWRLPPVMLTTLALMYRYVPVLAEEARRMSRARASRSFSSRRRLSWNNLALIIGQLFIRSAERAERIYLAMCARGWK
jgi:cobalt/nickel transport system permease protein